MVLLMSANRRYTKKPPAGFDSKQEKLIAEAYPSLVYHPTNPIFYTQDFRYLPDFFWGNHPTSNLRVYVEAKEWFPHPEVAKYLAIVDSNPGMYLVVICPQLLELTRHRLDTHPRLEVHVDLDTLPKWMLPNV